MLRGLYAAATALDAATQNHEVTAHNLSHSSTPGYKQRGTLGETFDIALGRIEEPTGDSVGTRVRGVYHDFRPGPIAQTGHPYDLALADPDTFFSVTGPDGQQLYTRSGAFNLTATGQLVAAGSGYPVQGEAGPLAVPATALNFNVASDGSVTADGVPIGRVRLTRFTDRSQLTAAGPSLYTAPPEAGPQAAAGRVVQGYREGSNVQPAEAMVQLILGARYYDAAQRAMRTIAESVQLNTRPQT